MTFSLANLSRCAAGGPEHEIGRTSLNWQHLLYKIDALMGFGELLRHCGEAWRTQARRAMK